MLPLRTGQKRSKPSAAQAPPRHPNDNFPVLSTGDNRDFATVAAALANATVAADLVTPSLAAVAVGARSVAVAARAAAENDV